MIADMTQGRVHLSISLIIISFFLGIAGAAGQSARLMEQANQAYGEKSYNQAIQLYEQLLEQGYTSAALHYNLANAYYRKRELAKAILHYERARQSAPGDEDIKHNLAVARAQQTDAIEPLPEFFLSAWWKSIRARLTTSGWSILGLLLLWWSAAGFILWLWGSTRTWRKRGFVAGFVLLGLSVLPFVLAISRAQYDNHSGEAILMAQETALRAAPDEDSRAITTIHEGLKLELIDQIGEWYKVRLPDGEVGWMPQQAVAVI